MTAVAIELRDVTKRFAAVTALDHVSLTVPAGSVFGFLGPNGAGKTTTLRLLTGLARPGEGAVRVLGHDAADAEVRLLTGYLPDAPSFYGWMTAAEYLRFSGCLFGLPRDVLERRVAALLDLAGLTDVRHASAPTREA